MIYVVQLEKTATITGFDLKNLHAQRRSLWDSPHKGFRL